MKIQGRGGKLSEGYTLVATGGLAGDIGSVLAGVRIECIGWWDAKERVFTSWKWNSPNQKVNGWLPK